MRKISTPIVLVLGLLLLLAGCRSGKQLNLYKPGDIAVWRTADTSGTVEAVDYPKVRISTNFGTIIVELFEDEAPVSVANFLDYVDAGFYEGTIFHRVISGFMIQGGGFTPDLEEKEAGTPIVNEAGNGLRNSRGTLAMARTNDLNSATAQFYINLVDNAFLNGDGISGGYAVFGRVYDGMAVVDKIAISETGSSGVLDDVPVEPIIIESITRID